MMDRLAGLPGNDVEWADSGAGDNGEQADGLVVVTDKSTGIVMIADGPTGLVVMMNGPAMGW